MLSSEIRKKFLKFFSDRGHKVVPSSSLVPANDPTLLFANAGMNQFKDVFLGREKRSYTRACSAQKCVRAGGKHNDLEQVGRTRRHHTFFEMLGNFSFGPLSPLKEGEPNSDQPYFKMDAIAFAWELVTSPNWLGIPKDKLYVTVFGGAELIPLVNLTEDIESRGFWLKEGVDGDRIISVPGLEENFWAMGDTGPCGPCSEIHYDMGPEASDLGHKDCKFPCPEDCGRYVEIWNLVFMQYNRLGIGKQFFDEKDQSFKYPEYRVEPLPRPSIDTGAGLERLAAVLQGKLSNFDTDLFKPLIDEAAELASKEYGENHETDVSLRIIADHARAATFLISDGVLPSNEGRGYVLRRIMRRAMLHGRKLGLHEPFLYNVSARVAGMMRTAYPELAGREQTVAKVIKTEEARFAQTLDAGVERLEGLIRVAKGWLDGRSDAELAHDLEKLSGQPTTNQEAQYVRARGKAIDGEAAFRLYDTFGLPLDIMRDAAHDAGVGFDQAGFDRAIEEQRARARASWKGAAKKAASPIYESIASGHFRVPQAEGGAKIQAAHHSEFLGYEQTNAAECEIYGIIQNGESQRELRAGEAGEIVLDHTPFYAEAGGQVGDVGHLYAAGSDHEVAHVLDTYRPVTSVIAHKGVARDTIRVGDVVTAVVDAERRDAIRRNHTATHLLHAALHEIVGTHAKQAGSLVAPDRLRFDFTHYASLSEQDVLDIEDLVNQHILKNEEVTTEVTELDKAIESGAMALFGEKYGEQVRVVSIDSFSKELCGGTHVARTGDIGLFKIISEGSISSGTRRMEAVTGQGVLEHLRNASRKLALLGGILHAEQDELLESAEKLAESEKKLRKQLEAQQAKRAATEAADLVGQAREIKGVRVISQRVEVTDRVAMRQMIDSLRPKLGSGVMVIGSAADGKVNLIAAVTEDLTAKLDAGKIVREAAKIVEGTGGGRKDLAEAGGKNAEKLDEALRAVPGIIERML